MFYYVVVASCYYKLGYCSLSSSIHKLLTMTDKFTAMSWRTVEPSDSSSLDKYVYFLYLLYCCNRYLQ